MTIGDRIRTARKQCGMTQTELAEAVETSKQNICKVDCNLSACTRSVQLTGSCAAEPTICGIPYHRSTSNEQVLTKRVCI